MSSSVELYSMISLAVAIFCRPFVEPNSHWSALDLPLAPDARCASCQDERDQHRARHHPGSSLHDLLLSSDRSVDLAPRGSLAGAR